MKRKLVLLVGVLILTGLVVGCNKSPINLYDYTHKPAVEFQQLEEQRRAVDEILSNFKEKGGF